MGFQKGHTPHNKRAEEPAPTAAPSEAAATDELAALAAALASAGADKARREAALGELEGFLSSLSPKDYPTLVESPAVQRFLEQIAAAKATSPEARPGAVVQVGPGNAVKRQWTWNDLKHSDIPVVEFEVHEPETVIWNGLRRDYGPGEQYADYRCFYDLIREKNRLLKVAREHAAFLFKQGGQLSDPSVAAGIGTGRVRGTGDGRFQPGAGTFTPEFKPGGGEDK